METQKSLLKDEDGEEVHVHIYRSMIGSLMYLTSSRPDIMFVVCACARYQVNPKVSHLHAVKRIFRYLKGQPKLGLWYPKDSLFDLVAYTDSDYARASLDMKSTTRGCQFFGCRLISWQCKKQTVVANSIIKVEYAAASSCCGQVLWIQNQLLDYGYNFMHTKIFIDNNRKAKKSVKLMMEKLFGMELELIMSTGVVKTINEEVQLHALVDGKKIIIYEVSVRRDLKLEDEEVVQHQSQMGEGSANPTDPHHTPTIIQPSTQPQKTQKLRKSKRKDTREVQLHAQVGGKKIIISEASVRKDLQLEDAEGEDVHKELNDSLVRDATTASSLEAEQDSGGGPRCQETMVDTIAQTRVLDLEKTKTTQANEIASLKRRVKKLEKKSSSRTHKLKRLYKIGLTTRVESFADEEDLGEDASKQGRRINAIDADEDITIVNVQDDADNEMFDVDALNGEEVFVARQNENVVEKVVDAAQVSTAAITVTVTTKEITLAQALEALKTSKPKVKGIVFQELGKSTTTKTISSQKSQDKGKGITIEEPVKPIKKKDQISFDEEVALKLQAEFDEEESLAREIVEKEKEANIALIKEWDDIQAKIDADYELAERLQAQEQEELSVEEKAKLFQQLLEQIRKNFATKSVEEKRNKPPNQAQQRKIMCTYLKNMEGKKLKDL
ncbi:hypothetical protein Tco_0901687 [Tanacetum coccineum]